MTFRHRIMALLGNPLLVLPIIAVVSLLIDHAPRFYQGDSLSYMTTGLSGWIPPDRSWAYGFASRLLVMWTHRIWVLLALQTLLLAVGIGLLQRALASRMRSGVVLVLLLPVALMLDPLNEAYARAWLSDTPACALFLAALAEMFAVMLAPRQGAAWRGILHLVASLVLVVATVFLRVAYVPTLLATLLLCLVVSFRPAGQSSRDWRIRKRALALCLIPLLALCLLAEGNARVAMKRFLGEPSVNRMSSLYSMVVFLPALHRSDLERAGLRLTPSEFAGLHLERYDEREAQLWNDRPGFLIWQMRQALATTDPYDPRLQVEARAVMRSALLHHPEDLLETYLWSAALYLSPREWSRVIRGELGFELSLPDWARGLLETWTGTTLPTDLTSRRSLWPPLIFATAAFYPFLLGSGLLASLRLLTRRGRIDVDDLLAAAMIASFATTPLYSHAVKPRYVLAPVLLSAWCVALVLATASEARRSRVSGL